MSNDSFSNDNNHVVLSRELLELLEWLCEHEPDELRKVVDNALKGGLLREIRNAKSNTLYNDEEMQYSVVEFFTMLETLLLEVLNEHAVQNAVAKNLMPAIEHIDQNLLDNGTLRSSIERTTALLHKRPDANAQDILFKELLRNWKPGKNRIVH